MLRVVICEDDREMALHIEQTLNDIYSDLISINIRCICDVASLVDLLQEKDSADILLLDIELKDFISLSRLKDQKSKKAIEPLNHEVIYNSIELVKSFRNPDSMLQIIYISGHIGYCTDVYDTPHISFLHEPFTHEQLKKALDKAIKTSEEQRQGCLAIKRKSEIHLLPFRDILYIESDARLLRYKTCADEIVSYGKITEVLTQLPAQFIQCHQSFIVNITKISGVLSSDFKMQNGDLVHISQKYKKAVMEKFFNYVEGKPWSQ